MAKKKGKVVPVHLVCTECGEQNYTIKVNTLKVDVKQFTMNKYSPKLRKHTIHKASTKMK